jgi:hypothetical protein
MKAYDDQGRLLNAEFEVAWTTNGFDLTLHANGGISRGRPALNPDYIGALELLLVRIANLRGKLDGCWVDSKAMRSLDPSERSVVLSSWSFPVSLDRAIDIPLLRLEIRRGVSRPGVSKERRPGTGNKRIKLAVSLSPMRTREEIQDALLKPKASERIRVENFLDDIEESQIGDFDCDISASLLDADSKRRLAQLARNGSASVRMRVTRYIERGPIGFLVKQANDYRCQICDALGLPWVAFLKPDGVPYVEAHHVVLVSTLATEVLAPENVITVCPNHHRQIHFGNCVTSDLGEAFEFRMTPHPPFSIRKFQLT